MNNFFIGPFKKSLFEYYQYKVSLGYIFEGAKNRLKIFDKYTCSLQCSDLTLQLIYNYLDENKNIVGSTRNTYASAIRGYVQYLYDNGKCNFILSKKLYRKIKRKLPHIYKKAELKSFFKALKDYSPNDKFKNNCFNLIFQLLYCTGMRIKECLNIKLNDIDFTTNSITLYNTKNNIDRRIVLKDAIMNEVFNYVTQYQDVINCNKEKYIFINSNLKKYNKCNVYYVFRVVLKLCGLHHDKNGPRIHDFRHTFCVNSYKQILKKGGNYLNHIMALSAYLGHKSFISTEYYLRLTAELYPEIRNIINNYTGNIVKDMGDLYE